jgi:hypothetical protein
MFRILMMEEARKAAECGENVTWKLAKVIKCFQTFPLPVFSTANALLANPTKPLIICSCPDIFNVVCNHTQGLSLVDVAKRIEPYNALFSWTPFDENSSQWIGRCFQGHGTFNKQVKI